MVLEINTKKKVQHSLVPKKWIMRKKCTDTATTHRSTERTCFAEVLVKL